MALAEVPSSVPSTHGSVPDQPARISTQIKTGLSQREGLQVVAFIFFSMFGLNKRWQMAPLEALGPLALKVF